MAQVRRSARLSQFYLEFWRDELSDITSLTDLTVHLAATSCSADTYCCRDECDYDSDGIFYHAHGEPLRISSPQSQSVVADWIEAAQFISSHIVDFQLKLHLICDVEDTETARAILEPLRSFPILAQCNIRLGRHRDSSLEEIATIAGLNALGKSYILPSVFPFFNLPVELQVQVLGYTDLRTPLGEVNWTPNGFHLRKACNPPGVWHAKHEGWEHYACQVLQCYAPTGIGCFCHRYHASFSTICKCWIAPTAFFLVSRAMRELAQYVFFSKNRFVIHHAHSQRQPKRLEASIFLRDILTPALLSCLTRIELVFPPFDDYLHPDEPAHSDWIQTIERIKDKVNPAKLTVCIYLRDFDDDIPATTRRRNLTKEQGMELFDTYCRIISPFGRINGLQRLFVHAALPCAWSTDHRRMLRASSGDSDRAKAVKAQIDDMKKDLNKDLEQRVMGSGYDSELLGKYHTMASRWWAFWE